MRPVRLSQRSTIALTLLSVCMLAANVTTASESRTNTAREPAKSAGPTSAKKTSTPATKKSVATDKATAPENQSDIRVLIDVSGSMKKTDPQNLRAPAIKLLSQLLPENSKAGIWTFGQNVSELVPLGKVDKAWRKKALEKVAGISSDSVYTNIGLAMDRASNDFNALPVDARTSVILLTDGMVDVSRNPDDNTVERNRILDTVLARYKKARVAVHTIALSEQADADLMNALASSTDGLAMRAGNAEELMKLFNQLLRQETKPEQLPLNGNSFLADSSISEFTLLAMHHPQSAPTQLESPDKNRYTAKSSDPYINWYTDDRYDLITVKQPLEGEWKLIAANNPDNRVTIISDLKAELAPLANNYNVGDTPELDVHFTQNGKPIDNPEFFKLITADADITNSATRNGWKTALQERNGHFRQTLQALSEPGDYNISVKIDGKTFMRQLEHSIHVNAPAPPADSHEAPAAESPTASAHETHTEPAEEHADTAHKAEDDKTGHAPKHEAPATHEAPVKHETPEKHEEPAKHEPAATHEAPAKAEDHHADTEHEKTATSEHENSDAKASHEETSEKKTPWWIYAALVVGNLLLVGIGYFAWRFLSKNKQEAEGEDSGDGKEEKSAKGKGDKDKKH